MKDRGPYTLTIILAYETPLIAVWYHLSSTNAHSTRGDSEAK